MKTKLLNIIFIAFAVVFLAGCRKKENLNATMVGLGGDTWVKSELDEWLYTNFTKPYNIEVKYRWDRSELGQIYKNVAPIKQELVKPVMQAVKEIWIEPYIAVKNQNFLKKYCQKQFYLAGSPSYNNNGTITLGIAEGGRKIILLNLNVFDKAHKPQINEILHTIHHEFAHILNQNIAVDPEYRKITPDDYTATWFNVERENYSTNEALDKILYEADFWGKGFITPYAKANKDEDFVEMQSMLLIYGQTYFDDIINNLFVYDGLYIKRNAQGVYEKNTDARNKLLKKKAMMVSYLTNSWGINFADLQAKTQAAIEKAIPTPDLHTVLGFDKTYAEIAINPQKLTGLSAKFFTAFNTANKAMLAAPNSRYIDKISLIFDTDKTMILRVNYLNPLEPPSYFNNYNADFNYTISNTDGLITLKYTDPQPINANARDIERYLPALLAYFNDQEFNVRWVDDIIPQSKGIFGGLVKKTDPNSYLFGTLEIGKLEEEED